MGGLLHPRVFWHPFATAEAPSLWLTWGVQFPRPFFQLYVSHFCLACFAIAVGEAGRGGDNPYSLGMGGVARQSPYRFQLGVISTPPRSFWAILIRVHPSLARRSTNVQPLVSVEVCESSGDGDFLLLYIFHLFFVL